MRGMRGRRPRFLTWVAGWVGGNAPPQGQAHRQMSGSRGTRVRGQVRAYWL